jgi:hypothetical protein
MGDTVSTLLFQPPPPSKLKEHKIVWLTTSRGTRIPGFYIAYRREAGVETCRSLSAEEIRDSHPHEGVTILYSHANAEDLGSIYPWCKFLSKMLQVNLFAYDYTGYGMAVTSGKSSTLLGVHGICVHLTLDYGTYISSLLNFRTSVRRTLLRGYRGSLRLPETFARCSRCQHCLVRKIARIRSLVSHGSTDRAPVVQKERHRKRLGLCRRPHSARSLPLCIPRRRRHGLHALRRQVSQSGCRALCPITHFTRARH